MDFLPCMIFLLFCIDHLESVDQLVNARSTNVDTVCHAIFKKITFINIITDLRVSQCSDSVVLSFLKFNFLLKTQSLSLSTNLPFSVLFLEVKVSLCSQIQITSLSVVHSNKSGVLFEKTKLFYLTIQIIACFSSEQLHFCMQKKCFMQYFSFIT